MPFVINAKRKNVTAQPAIAPFLRSRLHARLLTMQPLSHITEQDSINVQAMMLLTTS